jgi:hypothetical protein
MKKEFRFLDKSYSLEMGDSNSSDGDFEKCDGRVYDGKLQYQGVFKLTKIAWEKASQKAQEKEKPLDEILVTGCIEVLKAELYIRNISDEFSYVTDHRFFEDIKFG